MPKNLPGHCKELREVECTMAMESFHDTCSTSSLSEQILGIVPFSSSALIVLFLNTLIANCWAFYNLRKHVVRWTILHGSNNQGPWASTLSSKEFTKFNPAIMETRFGVDKTHRNCAEEILQHMLEQLEHMLRLLFLTHTTHTPTSIPFIVIQARAEVQECSTRTFLCESIKIWT